MSFSISDFFFFSKKNISETKKIKKIKRREMGEEKERKWGKKREKGGGR